MKYTIILLFVLGISLFGFSEAFAQTTIYQIPINSNSDDAMERNADGQMDLNSPYLNIGQKTIGLKFDNIPLEKDQIITNAYIQFYPSSSSPDTNTSVRIVAQDDTNPLTFSNTDFDITHRTVISDTVLWNNIPAWTGDSVYMVDAQTPNISSLIEQIISKSNWENGDSLSIILSNNDGEGYRVAFSHDNSVVRLLDGLPTLVIEVVDINPPLPPQLTIEIVNPPNSPDGGTFEFDVTHVTFESTTKTYQIISTNNAGITNPITNLIPYETYDITKKTFPIGFTVDYDLTECEDRNNVPGSRITVPLGIVIQNGQDILCTFYTNYVPLPNPPSDPINPTPQPTPLPTSQPPTLEIIVNTVNAPNTTFQFVLDDPTQSLFPSVTTDDNHGTTGKILLIDGYHRLYATQSPTNFGTPNLTCTSNGSSIPINPNNYVDFPASTDVDTICTFIFAYSPPFPSPTLPAPTLTIRSVTTNGDGTFDYTVTSPNAVTQNATINTNAGIGFTPPLTLNPGVEYTVTQVNASVNFVLSSEGCLDENMQAFPPTFTLVDGQSIACTFTNEFSLDNPNIIIEIPVNQSSDDGYEYEHGDVHLNDNTIEFGQLRMPAIRFNDIPLESGDVILNAYIQFVSDSNTGGSNVLQLDVYGQDDANPSTFETNLYDISTRPLTTSHTAWNDIDWTYGSGINTRTPDLVPIIEELINKPDWNSGNSMAFIFNTINFDFVDVISFTYDAYDITTHPVLVIELESSTTPPPSTTTEQQKKKLGGGGCSDCIPPTMGLDKNGKRLVDYGFSFNGNKIQVEKGHTPYPLINATVGETNLLETKFYDNFGVNNMLWVQTCFGATETYQPLNDCEALIEVHLDTDGTTDYLGIKEIKIIDDDNLLDNESVNATSYVTQCKANSDRLCGKVDLSFEFREAPINHMVITQPADKSGNAQQFSFNEGINVNGESVNEPPTFLKFTKQTSQDITDNWSTFTRTDKVNDIWTDENQIEYHRISDNRYERITPLEPSQCTDIPLSEMMVPDRINCNYPEYVKQQAKEALLIMEKICPSCLLPSYHEMKESFTHDVLPRIDKLNDPQMILLMEQEAQRALEYLQSHRQ